jgi:signal transduction histidine kinase/ActR/RegA family two-component response regulator
MDKGIYGSAESNQSRFNRWLGFVFLALSILQVLAFLIGHFFFRNDPINEGWVKEYTGVWKFETSDGEKGSFIAPFVMPIADDAAVTITTTLPEDLTDRTYFAIFTGISMKVYVGDDLRYSYDAKSGRFPGGSVKAVYFFVPVNSADCGKTMTIVREDTYASNSNVNEVLYGDYAGLIQYMFHQDGVKYFANLFLVFLSMAGMVIGMLMRILQKRPNPMVLLYSGIFAVSAWILLDSYLFQFIFRNYEIDGLFAYMTIMLVPIPFIRYLDTEQEGRYQKLYIGMEVVLGVQYIVLTVLHFTGVCFFFDSQLFMNILMGVCIGVLAAIYLLEWVQGYAKRYYLLGIGLLILMISGIVELMLIFFVVRYSYGLSVVFGMYGLLIMATVHTILRLMKREKETNLAITANEMKNTFLANMSHEIRTPIGVIRGLDEMILRESSEKNVLESAGKIQDATDNLLVIVNDILDFSRIESGRMEIVKGAYALKNMITDLVSVAQDKASAKGLEFKYEISRDLPEELIGDETRIRQILMNLLSNAVKYTSSGTVTLRIEGSHPMGGTPDDYLLRMEVSDTGIGIREKDMDRLFRSFERLDREANRGIEGTGLGLAITSRLVDQMNGVISVDSKYREGSTFTVVLPQTIRRGNPIGSFRYTERGESKALFTAPAAKVLVVDDNDMNLYVVKRLLEETKVQVNLCPGAKEMLEEITKEKYDVILLDIMMPKMDGVTALGEMKRKEGSLNDNTPVVALTANALAGAREGYLRQGFDEYMSKPIDGDLLEEILLRFIPREKLEN